MTCLLKISSSDSLNTENSRFISSIRLFVFTNDFICRFLSFTQSIFFFRFRKNYLTFSLSLPLLLPARNLLIFIVSIKASLASSFSSD